MQRLQQLHDVVGYSGHERGIAVSLAAVALGAQIVESMSPLTATWKAQTTRHLEPTDLYSLIQGIREIEAAKSCDAKTREISQGELINRENLAKSLVAKTAIEIGTEILDENVEVKSPGQGLSPLRYDELIGKKLSGVSIKVISFSLVI